MNNTTIFMGLGSVAVKGESYSGKFTLATFDNLLIKAKPGLNLDRTRLSNFKIYFELNDKLDIEDLYNKLSTISRFNKKIKYRNVLLNFECDKTLRSLRIIQKEVFEALKYYNNFISC